MGFFDDIGKSISKAAKNVTNVVAEAIPDVTLGDPSKLISQPVEGVFNAIGRMGSSAVGNAGDLLSQSVTEVGEALSAPGADKVLGALGSYFGVPDLGRMVSQFSNPATGNERGIEPPSSTSKSMPLIIGVIAGVGVLILTIFLVTKKGK